MSKTVDQERADIAAEEENLRLERLLLELLAVVKARARRQPAQSVAAQLSRSPRTITNRQQFLLGLLDTMKRKGFRRAQ